MNDYILNFLKNLMSIDSPSGYTKEVIAFCKREPEHLGFCTQITKKGNLEINVNGKDDCYEMTFVKYEFTFFNQGHWTGNFLI